MLNKKFLRRVLPGLIALILCLSCSAVPGFSSSGAIHSIVIATTLDKNGNAYIQEDWNVTVPDSWSELYTVKSNLGDMKILHFQVESLDTGKKFTSVGNNWNVNTGRTRKTNRCGIHKTDNGDLELCWGVGSSGHHRYRISYEMTNAVKSYTDGYDGFNIRFVNEGLSSEPEQVKVTITGPEKFTKQNTAMWAFGLQGTTTLQNGSIVTESSGQVNYCNILVRFSDGLFTPISKSNQSFARLQKKAMRHSDYQNSNGLNGWSILGIGALIAVIAALFLAARGRKNDEKLVVDKKDRHKLKDPSYSRALPFNGNLEESYVVLKAVESHVPDSRILSAYLLKWFQNGQIRAEHMESGRWSLFGEKKQTVLLLGDPALNMSEPELKLWDILTRSAGENGRLEEQELYSWSKGNYERIENFYASVEQSGREAGEANGDIGYVEKRILLTHQEMPGLTESGVNRAAAMLGFKKYLKDFTIINERQAKEVGLWREYLIFASLFGIADEVAKEFKKLLPSYFEPPQEAGAEYVPDWDAFDLFIFLNMMDHISTAAYSGYVDGLPSESASSGLGGFTSLGGGGGFSGGGFGGGGR